MKLSIRKFFSPIINHFESGEEQYSYKPSHRSILMVVGGLFLVLSIISVVTGVLISEPSAAVPFLIFFSIGLVCIVLASVASDRAVAKIWGNK